MRTLADAAAKWWVTGGAGQPATVQSLAVGSAQDVDGGATCHASRQVRVQSCRKQVSAPLRAMLPETTTRAPPPPEEIRWCIAEDLMITRRNHSISATHHIRIDARHGQYWSANASLNWHQEDLVALSWPHPELSSPASLSPRGQIGKFRMGGGEAFFRSASLQPLNPRLSARFASQPVTQ